MKLMLQTMIHGWVTFYLHHRNGQVTDHGVCLGGGQSGKTTVDGSDVVAIHGNRHNVHTEQIHPPFGSGVINFEMRNGNDNNSVYLRALGEGEENPGDWVEKAPYLTFWFDLARPNEAVGLYEEVTPMAYHDFCYYCTIYFEGGYMGFQQGQGMDTRQLIFSVWDYKKVDPNDQRLMKNEDRIAKDDRSVATDVCKLPGVIAKRHGGEGTGFQIFVPYMWEAGKTYRWCVLMDTNGPKQTYTAYIAEGHNDWLKIGTIRVTGQRRSLGGTALFVEDNVGQPGSILTERHMKMTNQWVLYRNGQWEPVRSGHVQYQGNDRTKNMQNTGALKSGGYFFISGGRNTKRQHKGDTVLHASPNSWPRAPDIGTPNVQRCHCGMPSLTLKYSMSPQEAKNSGVGFKLERSNGQTTDHLVSPQGETVVHNTEDVVGIKINKDNVYSPSLAPPFASAIIDAKARNPMDVNTYYAEAYEEPCGQPRLTLKHTVVDSRRGGVTFHLRRKNGGKTDHFLWSNAEETVNNTEDVVGVSVNKDKFVTPEVAPPYTSATLSCKAHNPHSKETYYVEGGKARPQLPAGTSRGLPAYEEPVDDDDCCASCC